MRKNTILLYLTAIIITFGTVGLVARYQLARAQATAAIEHPVRHITICPYVN